MSKDLALSADEREEYDALMWDATHQADGTPRASRDVSAQTRRLLLDAEQAHKPWASVILDSILTEGAGARARRWLKTHHRVQVRVDESRTVSKSATRGVVRVDDKGSEFHQQMFWDDLGEDELNQVIRGCSARIVGERDTLAVARRFRRLLARTAEPTVAAALKRLDMEREDYLVSDLDIEAAA